MKTTRPVSPQSAQRPQRRIILVAAILLIVGSSCARNPDYAEPAAAIPIQHNGRIKSFEAFSRETVKLLTGKERWNGRPALEVILDGLAAREKTDAWAWIRLDDPELKKHLRLAEEEHFFTLQQLVPSAGAIQKLVHEAQNKRNKDERPSRIEQKAEELFSRMIAADEFQGGDCIAVIPATKDGTWRSPYREQSDWSTRFAAIVARYAARDTAGFNDEVRRWIDDVRKVSPDAAKAPVALELQYYNVAPFQISWIAYLGAFALLAGLRRFRLGLWTGLILLATGIAFHTHGLILRILILDRPPVSNMYESMIFMNWVLIVAAVIFALIRRKVHVLSVGAIVSALIIIYADLLPIDADLNVLVPVLRSNYWLTIHVLTIVGSYGVLGLAMGLGHRFLILDVLRKQTPESAAAASRILGRVIQIGALLLGIGTVLGGVWANESWGRFWGWDPKETWALIAFLGYLLIIHLRYTGRLGDFAFALSSIVAFQLVLMTWYGVNFILGRGLHSYGFGAGGMIWITLYLVAETIFIAFVLVKRYRISADGSHGRMA